MKVNYYKQPNMKAKERVDGYKPRVIVSTKLLNGNIEVRVKDNGPGIPDDVMSRIFEPFFTTKEPGEGVGLGLSVSYGIIETHQGEITVASEPGKGTAFTVTFPVWRGDRDG